MKSIQIAINDPDDLGRLVRKTRKDANMTLSRAAGLLGVGVRFLSELERGKQTAELGLTLKILKRLGLDLYIIPRGKNG